MNSNKKLILILGAVLLVAIGIFFLFKDNHGNAGQASSQGPAMEFNNIEMKEDKDGNAVWRLKAGYVAMSRDKNHADMKDIDGYFKKDDQELYLKADSGWYDRKEQKIYIEGHVEGHTSDGMILHAENLTYDGNKEILSSDKFFTAEKDGRVLSADSFTGDRVLEKLVAKGHAKLADKEETK